MEEQSFFEFTSNAERSEFILTPNYAGYIADFSTLQVGSISDLEKEFLELKRMVHQLYYPMSTYKENPK